MVSCVIGEILWDIFPDGERFGGAALNFCANLQRLGDQAILFSAVGGDQRGRIALDRMRELGLTTAGIRTVQDLPTGIATVRTGEDGEPTYVIPRPAAFDEVSVDPQLLSAVKPRGIDWLYFGTLLQTRPETELLTSQLLDDLRPARGFYDINLRSGHWNLPLVQRLSHLASVVKLNSTEAETLFPLTGGGSGPFSLEKFCQRWASTYAIDVICVTLGPEGCMIYDRGAVYRVAGHRVTVRDTVGSGDAFAAAFLHGYQRGWGIVDTARFANALGALVASLPGATPAWTIQDVLAIRAAE